MIKLKKEGENLMGYDEDNVACCYYPINSEAKEFDLLLLPKPFKEVIPSSGYEEGMFGYTDTEVRVAQNAFKEGYQAAQSKQYSLEDIEKILFDYDNVDWSKREHKQPTIMMKEWLKEKIQSLSNKQLPKQFSLEDMIAFGKKCFYKGFDKSENDDANCFTAWKEEANELLQSLSTQQLPKEFKPIMVCGRCLKPDDNDEDCWSAKECSRNTDFPDTFKTITNSEGKEELIGIYKY